MSVFNPMRLISFRSQPFLSVFLVIRIIALKPDYLGIAFKSQDVCGDPVEEPAVMADNDCTTAKIFKRLFQGAQGVNVKVVSWFIEKQDISAIFQHSRQMNTISLAAREEADLLLLFGPAEIEFTNMNLPT